MRKIKKTLAVSLELMLTASLWPGNGYVKAAEADGSAINVIEEEVTDAVDEEIGTEATEIKETEAQDAVLEDTVEEDVVEDVEEVAVNPSDKIAFTSANFPDANFRSYLKSEYDGMRYDEVYTIDAWGMNMSSLKGIELFPNLQYLYCEGNNLTSLDVSKNVDLQGLGCSGNNLTVLDVSKNVDLQDLFCSGNNLTGLDVSKNVDLQYLYCEDNNLTSLDVSKNVDLQELFCTDNNLTSLDVSKNVYLQELYCGDNNLTSLDVSKNVDLQDLYCVDNNLTSLDVSKNVDLQYLNCGGNNLTSLDVSKNVDLQYLDCWANNLTSLDVSKNVDLQGLGCSGNNLTSLDVSKNVDLQDLFCSDNNLASLDVSKNVKLKELIASGNKIKEINLNTNSNLGGKMYDYEDENGNIVEAYGWVQIDVSTTLSIPSARNIKSSDTSVAKVSGTKIIPQKTGKGFAECTITYTLNGKNISYSLHVVDASAEGIVPTEPITNPSYNIEVATKDNLQASITCSYSDMSMLEYSFYATKTPNDPSSYEMISDWNSSNKLNWTPSIYGDYTILGKIRVAGYPDTEVSVTFEYAYHPCIKGNCQMPYAMIAPGESGYLIGLETYSGTVDSVEMLILDCTSMQWTYSTGKNLVPENMLWTVWQPQYGYYWTLFRAYDAKGTLIDEVCYGFVNAY